MGPYVSFHETENDSKIRKPKEVIIVAYRTMEVNLCFPSMQTRRVIPSLLVVTAIQDVMRYSEGEKRCESGVPKIIGGIGKF